MEKIRRILSKYWPAIFFITLYFFIFRKIFFLGLVPFPGDLLTSWFFPYSAGGWEGYSQWITHKEYILADVVRQLYPWRILAFDLLQAGSIPLWNIYSFAGNPLIANVQSAVFYPLNLIFFILKPQWAWITYIMIQPILATFFMYLFIRSLKLSKLAAIFAGIAFTFTGYMMVWFEMGVLGHAALWLPFILWGITKFFNTNKKLYIVLSSFGIACSILAGHTQTTAYVLIFTLSYFLYCGWGKVTKRAFLIAAGLLSLGITLAGIQIIPSFELQMLSPRDAASSIGIFHKFITPPSHIAMLFAPDFFGNPATNNFWGKDYGEFMSYVGVVVLLFGAIGFYTNFKRKLIRMCLVILIISFLIAFVPFIANLLFLANIPILSTSLPSRAIFLIGVCFSIAAAFGVESVWKEKSKKILVPIFIILGIYIILWIVTFLPQFDVAKIAVTRRNLLLPTGIAFFISFLLLFRNISKRYFILWIMIFACMTFEYSYFLNKYLPMAPANYIFPQQELVTKLQEIAKNDRVYGYDTATIGTNLPVQWRIQTIEGYDPLYIKNYAELMRAATTGKLETDLPRSDALLPNSLPAQDSHQKQVLLNLLGVKYLLDKDDTAPKKWDPNTNKFPEQRFNLIYQQGKWKIYQNKQVLPRAMVFHDYTVVPQKDRAIATLFNPNFHYTQELILASQPKLQTQNAAPEPARITSYTANTVTITTKTKTPGILFLSDNYYPGWQATVDNKSTPILLADYSFRAVEVPQGTHTIVFEYKPTSFYLGALISLLSLITLLYFLRK